MRALALAVVLAALSLPAWAGEEQTTWRAGDQVVYRAGCHDLGIMTEVAEAGGRGIEEANALWSRLLETGQCYVLPRPIPAVLQEWISGPYAAGSGKQGSLWRIVDAIGDTEFMLLLDTGGPHGSVRQENS